MTVPDPPPSDDNLTHSQPASDGSGQTAPHPSDRPLLTAGNRVPNAELWVLEEELGRGGFGEVWRARHHITNELRAIKFCLHPTARGHLFTHEAKIVQHVRKHMAALDGCHPSIVPLLDCNLTGNLPWLMYEYVPGGRTLANVIEGFASHPVPERIARTIRIMHVIAGAVGQFHSMAVPIVHRDLKHKNILMHDEMPRITDFGIGGAAVTAAVSDATGGYTEITVNLPSLLQTSGTPPHASPQQLAGKEPDPRDDVYAMGVMTYQLLTARGDAKVQGFWHRRLADNDVPEALIDLIGRSTSDEPDERPKDAAEWERALAALRTREPHPPASQSINIFLPGVWMERSGATDVWQIFGTTPGDLPIQFDREYSLNVHKGITDAELLEFCVLVNEQFAAVVASGRDRQSSTPQGRRPTRLPLHSLDLSLCQRITDVGLACLQRFTSLRSLNLNFCRRITNVGMEQLQFLALQSLTLAGCNITDNGLMYLSKLTGLQYLDLRHCAYITDLKIQYLSAALPSCVIVH